MRAFAAVLFSLSAAGCSYLGSAEDADPSDFEREDGWIAVRDVPVVLQQSEEDCGAATMAMALAYWGVPALLDTILEACPPKSGEGIKAGALRDYARSLGFQAFLFHGTISDFEKELSRGRPVVVGLVKPHVNGGLTHFELVVGVHRDRQLVATLDPARGWRRNSTAGFLAEWEPAGRLTLVMMKSPPPPAGH
jgi:ABC-type bacteriocin/lantibiotic exporter with double-glycine peptidase domain